MVLNINNEGFSQRSLFVRAMGNAWFASAIEVAFALIVSNLAVFISIFVYLLMQNPGVANWDIVFSTLENSIKPTEIIVYILGFISPAIWIIVKNFRLWRHLSFLFLLLTLQALVVLSTAIIFAMSIAQTLRNIELATHWAWWCLVVALIVWYATLVYQKKVLDGLGEHVDKPKPGKESGSDVLAALEAKG